MPALPVTCRLLLAPPLRTQPAWHLLLSHKRFTALRLSSCRAMAHAGRSDSAAAAAATASAAHLVWFRPGDLRLSDHEPLHTAASCLQSQLSSDSPAAGQPAPLLVPFFCLDERQLAAAPHSLLGLPQLGPHRLRCALCLPAEFSCCVASAAVSWHAALAAIPVLNCGNPPFLQC